MTLSILGYLAIIAGMLIIAAASVISLFVGEPIISQSAFNAGVSFALLGLILRSGDMEGSK